MKKISVIGATLLAAAVLCAAPISLHQSLSLSVDKAQARVGRPLTPGSVAGVHRRHHRRCARWMETFALTITKTPPICAGEYRAEFKAAWNGRGYSHHRYRYW